MTFAFFFLKAKPVIAKNKTKIHEKIRCCFPFRVAWSCDPLLQPQVKVLILRSLSNHEYDNFK